MAPTDNSPTHPPGGFELITSLQAYNRIPVYEFKSIRTGLTVVIAEVEGPVVNGYFCLATEAHDDDGLPHTLEHLIFLGSEDYPYKGVLDLLANRCLASGTNAWTDIDHTCYTMETAGSEGFLLLLPIFLEHILYPTLSDEGFLTEVHHVTEKGEDAGVVYCEMQGRENSGESRVHLAMARAMYPGRCGYSSETGGIMKNLRESTTNEKVRKYHEEFYRPENLKVIITGQVKAEEVFKALARLEDKIVSRGGGGGGGDGGRRPFLRPWQDAVPPLPGSRDLEVLYPCDEESHGIVSVAWRGPSAVSQLYELNAAAVALKYLTDTSVSPLQREFVEQAEPLASRVAYNLYENSESVLYLLFENVPAARLRDVAPRLESALRRIVERPDELDMARLRAVVRRHRLESLSNLENNPHQTVAFAVIGHALYGRDRADLERRLNPPADLERMEQEPCDFWLALLRARLVEGSRVLVVGVPSRAEQARMAAEEAARVASRRDRLGAHGLAERGSALRAAVMRNEREPPRDLLTAVAVPSADSIRFHGVSRHSTTRPGARAELARSPLYTYLDHVDTSFVYLFALLDAGGDATTAPALTRDQLLRVPLLLETLFESPLKRAVGADGVPGELVPYDVVVAELEADTVAAHRRVGLGAVAGDRFSCGPYAATVSVALQVEERRCERGARWLADLLYRTELRADRLQVVAAKMHNHVAQARRAGSRVASALLRRLLYRPGSMQRTNCALAQQRFLADVLSRLRDGGENARRDVEREFREVRAALVHPSRVAVYAAANLERLGARVSDALATEVGSAAHESATGGGAGLESSPPPPRVTPDSALVRLTVAATAGGCVVGLGCVESAYLYHACDSITRHDDPDVPALLVYLQYVTQLEGPLWRRVRGNGFAYSYRVRLQANEGLLYLVLSRATDVAAAFREARDIVLSLLGGDDDYDDALLESARSSLIYEIIDDEKTVGHVVEQSLASYYRRVDYDYSRWLVREVTRVSPHDLDRVGRAYVRRLFEPAHTRTTVVCHPARVHDVAAQFANMDYRLDTFASLDEFAVATDADTD